MDKGQQTSDAFASDNLDLREINLQAADDGELLSLYVLRRDREYLAELIRRHYPYIHGLIARKLSCQADVEDAIQSTFLVFAQSAHRIRKRNSIAAWLYGVSLRICSRIVEKSRKGAQSNVASDIEETEAQEESPFLNVARRMQLDVLDQELSTVRESYREVLVEHYLIGRSAAEIANQFDVSLSTIEGRLRRGRAELRARLLRRGYSFTSILALFGAMQARVVEPAMPISTIRKLIDQLLEPRTSTDGSMDSIRTLANEEVSMTAYLTTKTSLMASTVCAVAIIGVLAVNLHGDQSGSGTGSGEKTSTTLIAKTPVDSSGSPAIQTARDYPSPAGNQAAASDAGAVEPVVQPVANAALPDWATRRPSDLPQKLGVFEIEPDWPEIPLSQVMQALADDLNIAIWLDEDGLQQLGVSTDYPITMQLPKIPFHQAMRMMLSQFDGGYYLDGDVVVVTSKRKADANPRIQVYDLLPLMNSKPELLALQKMLLNQLKQNEPELWSEGIWQATPVDTALILNCSDIVHRKFAADLTKLAHQLGKFKVPKSAQVNAGNQRSSTQDPFGGADPFSEVARNRSTSDPFGGNPGANNDPFGGNPFGSRKKPSQKSFDANGDDPFGESGGTSNPFGGADDSNDPFGGNPTKDNDPFGGNSNSDPFGDSSDDASDPFGA